MLAVLVSVMVMMMMMMTMVIGDYGDDDYKNTVDDEEDNSDYVGCSVVPTVSASVPRDADCGV